VEGAVLPSTPRYDLTTQVIVEYSDGTHAHELSPYRSRSWETNALSAARSLLVK
jgi:hypothetical protein